MLHALKFLSETLDSFFRKATMAQMFLSRTGGLSAPKLGIAVILMPFLITQNSSSGRISVTIALRSGGGSAALLCDPKKFAHLTVTT